VSARSPGLLADNPRPRSGAPGDDQAAVDRLGQSAELSAPVSTSEDLVAVDTDAMTGTLTSLATSGGSGLAVRAALIVALLAAASAAWWVAARRATRFRPSRRHPLPGGPATPVTTMTSTDLSRELGSRATFVQFSSATCATCPQVRRVLTELAATQPAVVHVDIQAEDHMDLVRRFSVYRTPTVLLLDPDGAVHARTSGPLTPARALAALAQLSHQTSRSIDV
jgi:thiol-disulfide isomerase/thioredoxin